MATWGAMLTDTSGVPFYIDDTLPLCLISKTTYSLNLNGGTVVSQPVHPNDGAVRFIFVNSPDQNVYFWYAYDSTSGTWRVYASCQGASAFRLTVYIFGYQYQTPPTWGVAIWDAQGRCVITNETKVLRGVNPIGTEGAENAGYNINTTLTGNIAVAPAMTGAVTGIIQSGGTRPFEARYYTSAYFNGSSTLIKSVATATVSGGVQNITYTNFRNTLTAVNVARY